MTGDESEGLSAEELDRLEGLVALGLNPLHQFKFGRHVLPALIAQARRASSSDPGREGVSWEADRNAQAYELVKQIGRLTHSGDEDWTPPDDDDDARGALDTVIGQAREIMSVSPLSTPADGGK